MAQDRIAGNRVAAAGILHQQTLRSIYYHGQCGIFSAVGNFALGRWYQQIGYRERYAVTQTNLLQHMFKGRCPGLFKQSFNLRLFQFFILGTQIGQSLIKQALA